MAAKEIKTTIKLDGEAKFKQAIKGARTEMSALKAEMKAQVAQFKAQGDAMGAARAEAEGLKAQQEQQAEIVKALESALEDATQKYGENSAKVQQYRIQLANAQTALSNMSMAADTAATNADNLSTSMDGAGKAVEDAAEDGANGLDGIRDALAEIADNTAFSAMCDGLALVKDAASFAWKEVKQLYDLVNKSSQWADDLLTLSITSGIDTDTLQQMQYASRFVDTEVDTIIGSIKKLKSNMDNAKDMQTLGELLHVSAYDSETGKLKDGYTFFTDIMDQANKLGIDLTKNTEMANAFYDVFGRGADELQPLISGWVEYKQKMQEASDKNYVLDEEDVNNLGDYNDGLQELTTAMETFERVFASTLSPVFNAFNEGLTDVLNDVTAWLKDSDVAATLEGLTNTIGNVMGMISQMVSGDITFSELLDTIQAWLEGDDTSSLESMIGNAITTMFGAIVDMISHLFDVDENGESVVSKISEAMGTFILAIFGGIRDAISSMLEDANSGDAVDMIATGVNNLLKAFVSGVSALFDFNNNPKTQEMFNNIETFVENLFEGLIKGILQFIDDTLGTNLVGDGKDWVDGLTKHETGGYSAAPAGSTGSGFYEAFTPDEYRELRTWLASGAPAVGVGTLPTGILSAFNQALKSGDASYEGLVTAGVDFEVDDETIAEAAADIKKGFENAELYVIPFIDSSNFETEIQDGIDAGDYTVSVTPVINGGSTGETSWWSNILGMLPGHADGLDSVPYDNYVARLHKSEMVLTASEAKSYRQSSISEASLDTLANKIVKGISNISVYLDNRKVGEGVAPIVNEVLGGAN